MRATIQSIEKYSRANCPKKWRLANALIPAEVAEIDVTVEKLSTLRPLVSLFLRTIQLLEYDNGAATLDELAAFTGLESEAIEVIVLRMVDEKFVLFDSLNRVVRQDPELQIENNQVRTITEETIQVCLIGRNPFPVPDLNPQHLLRSKAIPIDEKIASKFELNVEGWKSIGDDALNSWRPYLANGANIQKISLVSTPRPKGYLLSGTHDSDRSYILLDNRSKARVEFGEQHPFVIELRELATLILDSAKFLMSRFGAWNEKDYELRSNIYQWRAWVKEGGSSFSEVRISGGGIQIAIPVRSLPSDSATAQELFFDHLLERLENTTGPISESQVEKEYKKMRDHPDFRDYAVMTPTLAEIESAAWNRKNWPLAYQIGGAKDGLIVASERNENLN
jgi:hypothetical protein